MIPYMNLEEQVDSDFVRARLRALLRRVGSRFYKDPAHNRLLSFDEVREASLADNRTYLGTKIVEAEKPAVKFRCSLSAASRAARASAVDTREFLVGSGL